MTRQRIYLATAGLAIVAILAYGARTTLNRPPTWQARPGSAKRVLIVPFSTSGPIDGWSPAVFAESLAVCLNANPAVDARVGRDAADQADFALDGEVSMKDGHAVIALRLIPTGQRAASWSATFWRDNLGDSALAADLAGRVTEALGLANTTVDTPTAKTTPNTKAKEHLP